MNRVCQHSMDFFWMQFEKFTDMYDNRFRLSEYLLHDYVMFMHGFWRKWTESDVLSFRDALLYCFLFISGFYFSFKRMFEVRFSMLIFTEIDIYFISVTVQTDEMQTKSFDCLTKYSNNLGNLLLRYNARVPGIVSLALYRSRVES